MRSGRSVDDSSVKDQSRIYFDILSEPERRALYIFLDALAGIMTGTVDGQHAPDPGDHNVSISGKDKEQEAPARPKDTSPEQGDPGEDPQEEEDEPTRRRRKK